jgi:hypothetical protein
MLQIVFSYRHWILFNLCVVLCACSSAPLAPPAPPPEPIQINAENSAQLIGKWKGGWAVTQWDNDFDLEIIGIENGIMRGVLSMHDSPLGDKGLNRVFKDPVRFENGNIIWLPLRKPGMVVPIHASREQGKLRMDWMISEGGWDVTFKVYKSAQP